MSQGSESGSAGTERAPTTKASLIDRGLGLVTRVQPGEGTTALLMATKVLVLLCAYYLIKPVREALILSTGGAEIKSYASVGQAGLLVILVPLYGYLVARVRRQVLIPAVTMGFQACLVLFYFAAIARVDHLGVLFYLFVGIFNLMIVAQFWSFANDIYSKEQGERLFPVVAFGGSLGALMGSGLTSFFVRSVGVEQLLLVAAFVLGLSVVLTHLIETRVAGSSSSPPLKKAVESPQTTTEEPIAKPSAKGSFALVLKSRYLMMIAGLMFLLNLVNTTGEFLLGKVVAEDAAHAVAMGTNGGLSVSELIGAFYGDFFFIVNIVGAVLQLFVVSRIIRWFGVRIGLAVLPCIALSGYVLLALYPVLSVIRWAKTAENSTDYSLNNTVRNALFLPLSREEKYGAKQAVDTFVVRGGDVASAGVVALGTHLFSWEKAGFAWCNVLLTLVWLALALAIGRHYSRLKAKPSQ